jgi:serine phosphatase RsbU (regulator of sigma subunit)
LVTDARAGRSDGCASATAAASLELDFSVAAAIRDGRRFVEREVVARGATSVVDDVALAAAEMLANAVQHGGPPVTVTVAGGATWIRVEVADGSLRAPVRPAPSTTNMTGRGLMLVLALVTRWGVQPVEAGGKVVWAEFEPNHSEDAPGSEEIDIDALLAQWVEPNGDSAEARHTVVLGDLPTDLLLAAKAHIDNLVREFTLAAEATVAAPADLTRTISTVVHGFSDARDAIKRQALAAAQRGDVRTQLTLHLPVSAADAGEAYLAALDDADDYARAARLLTLESPAAHRLFRRWYVAAVVRQLRQVAAGVEPEPLVPFETHMLAEIERLAALQRITDRSARLQRVTAALASARTPEDVAAVVVSEGVAALRASGGGLLVPAEDGEHVAVPGTVGYRDELVGALREERLDATLPGATALRTGQAFWLESQSERDRLFPALRGFEADVVSMCAVPLVIGGDTMGALRFSFDTRRLFDDDEREFVGALAAQTAQTLVRTEAYATERRASLNLQRALLPQQIPDIAGWDLAAHYSPAGGQEAGGDFYDIIALRDGRVAVVVGDVMGRGVEAAAAMSQVRATIRAYAVDDPDPRVVFTKTDQFFAGLAAVQLVTVLYLLIEPQTGHLTIGNAGHLPPILVDAAGSRIAPLDPGIAFGVGGTGERVTSRLSIPHGGAVVIVTDGLVERRNEDIDVGINRVVTATGAEDCSSAAGLLDRVLSTAAPEYGDDDVTVVTLCRS